MTLWPKFIRRRWEQREAEADQAEAGLADAKVQHARAQRLTAESRQIKRANGFTEAVIDSMGAQR